MKRSSMLLGAHHIIYLAFILYAETFVVACVYIYHYHMGDYALHGSVHTCTCVPA